MFSVKIWSKESSKCIAVLVHLKFHMRAQYNKDNGHKTPLELLCSLFQVNQEWCTKDTLTEEVVENW